MSFASVLDRLQKIETPYPGLRPFETHESHLFFGRDQQVAELVARLERNRLVAVLGVSGSGKSSLVRAGLLPALERGGVADAGRRWRIIVTRPAGAPFDTLAAHLQGAGLNASALRRSSHGLIDIARQLPADESLLVVVDQFEELFRYKDLEPVGADAKRRHVEAAAEAADFVQLLLAASRHHPPIFIVLTMRSDYLGDCAEFRDLPEALNECQYLVPRLTREQRKEAIERPLGQTKIAPSAVQRMLNDAGDEPDQLPVLQHALMRTWRRSRAAAPGVSRRIELEDYEKTGGFEGALNQHADELLADVPLDTVATIFKRLTARGRGHRERRDPATLREVWAVCGADTPEQQAAVTAVVDHFRRGEATFLAPREGAIGPDSYIDITHESLIRQWKKLRDEWLPQERRSAKTFLDLVHRATRWKAAEGELVGGLDLFDAIAWESQRNPTAAWASHYAEPGDLERVLEFIEASRANERTQRFRNRTLLVVVPLAVVFAGLAIVAFNESRAASRLANVALDRQLTAQHLLAATNPTGAETTALIAAESQLRFPESRGLAAVRDAIATLPRTIATFSRSGPVKAAVFSADGRHVVVVGVDGAQRFDPAAKQNQPVSVGPANVGPIGISGDGRLLAVPAADSIALIDVETGRERHRLPIKPGLVSALSHNGRHFATASSMLEVSIFETATGQLLRTVAYANPVTSIAVSANGQWLATGTGPKVDERTGLPIPSDDANVARVTEVATGAQIARLAHQGAVRAVAFSSDGRYLATGSHDGTARVFEAAKGVELARLTHRGPVTAAAFSADSMWVASGSEDQTARVFEPTTGLEVARLAHGGSVNSVAFSGDGRWVVSGSADGTSRVFESTGAIELYRSRQAAQFAAFSGDGRRLVVGAGGLDSISHAEVLDGPAGRPIFVHEPAAPELRDVSISADGEWAILGGGAFGGKTRVFRVADAGATPRDLEGVAVPALAVSLSADGRRAAVLGVDGVVHVFDGVKEIVRVAAPFTHAMALTSDGLRLVTAGGNIEQGTAQVIAVPPDAAATGTIEPGSAVVQFTQPQPVMAVAISADGRLIATSSAPQGDSLRIFDESGTEIWSMHGLPLRTMALDSESRRVAAALHDGIVRVWDFAAKRDVATVRARQDVVALKFVESGRYLMIASRQAALHDLAEIVVTRYPLGATDVLADACSRVTRNLTQDEWNTYLSGEVPYRATCPGLPQ